LSLHFVTYARMYLFCCKVSDIGALGLIVSIAQHVVYRHPVAGAAGFLSRIVTLVWWQNHFDSMVRRLYSTVTRGGTLISLFGWSIKLVMFFLWFS
ncbi:hypothetical protein HMPREF9120_00920, partial [Neisseria sp. oral taxon 020 str. F0370]|uniref:hypothetical protein n=1 Tax=Neisseria sp. oral taxon 020 TaxID=712401 RepID=UPI0002A3628E